MINMLIFKLFETFVLKKYRLHKRDSVKLCFTEKFIIILNIVVLPNSNENYFKCYYIYIYKPAQNTKRVAMVSSSIRVRGWQLFKVAIFGN